MQSVPGWLGLLAQEVVGQAGTACSLEWPLCIAWEG